MNEFERRPYSLVVDCVSWCENGSIMRLNMMCHSRSVVFTNMMDKLSTSHTHQNVYGTDVLSCAPLRWRCGFRTAGPSISDRSWRKRARSAHRRRREATTLTAGGLPPNRTDLRT